MPENDVKECRTYLLQIDRVGSFRLILSETVLLSGPQPGTPEGVVQILGPLSRQHAEIRRHTTGYTLTPRKGAVQIWNQHPPAAQPGNFPGTMAETSACGTLLCGETLLTSRSWFELASGVSGRLRTPSPLCQTALLEIEPRERVWPQGDGILLVDRLVVLGPGEQAHISSRHWGQSGVLIFDQERISFRSPIGPALAENQEKIDLELPLNRYVSAGEFGFYLEVLTGEHSFQSGS